MVPYYSGGLFGLLIHDSLPAVAGLVLARRVWTGGRYVRWGLLAVAAVVTLQALGSLRYGDPRGFTQLLLPVTLIVLLCRPAAREWFSRSAEERPEPRPFSFARMILWRSRDEGQNTLEYVGLIVIVVAVIAALLATNMGPELSSRFSSAICTVTGGGDCGGGKGDGSDPVAEGPGEGGTKPEDGTGDQDGPAGGDYSTQDGSEDGPAERSPGRAKDAEALVARWIENDEQNEKTAVDHLRDVFAAPAKSVFEDVKDFASDPIGETWGGVEGFTNYTKDWFSDRGDSIVDAWNDGNPLKSGWLVISTPANFTFDLAVELVVDKENFKKGNWGAAFGNTFLNIASMASPRFFTKFKNLGKSDGKKPDKKKPDGKKPEEKKPEEKKPEDEPTTCPAGHSFPPGTRVLTAQGLQVPIESIRIGDQVVATDPVTGLTTVRTVSRTFTTYDDREFTRITTTAGPIVATDTHPFWLVDERRWADAGEIATGDLLRLPSGSALRVMAVTRYTQQQPTHDLAVSGIHSYYVTAGAAPVLVHNYTPPPADKKLPGFPDATYVGKGSPKPGGGFRARWSLPDGRVLEWDSQHGTIETWTNGKKNAKHLGEFDPNSGSQLPGRKGQPVPGRKLGNC
ncbi:colicin E3/pyocin S6 family cytotoxin [Streptomyces sp. NPDC048604]|uniref:colicin E3/pyocin S6 family cytotoxin n=1 Tax=Streptomyces sp. NPDC048604 TaxID=3365578 RepID=UPI003722D659